MKYSIKVGVTPSIVMYGPLHIVKCEVVINSADIVYCVPGTFLGPGSEAMSKKYMIFALSMFTIPGEKPNKYIRSK